MTGPRAAVGLWLVLAVAGLRAAPAPASAGTDVAALEQRTAALRASLVPMERSTARQQDLQACLSSVAVSEYGSPDGAAGYLYDARDGTGIGRRSALAIDSESRSGDEDYLFFDLSRRGDCGSDAPHPGGTAEAARTSAPTTARATRAVLRARVRRLERRVRGLLRATRRLAASAERFEAWESCLSSVPVTEYGDPDGNYGYLYDSTSPARRYRPAITIDRSDWDDPDYMLLALAAGDRPGGECRDEPGEAVD